MTENHYGHILLKDIWKSFEEHSGEKISLKELGKSIKKMFPDVKYFAPTEKVSGRRITAYRGISFNPRPKFDLDKNGIENVYSLEEISSKLPKHSMLFHSSISSEITFALPSNVLANGNLVLKTVTLKDHSWVLNIRGKEVDLHQLGISVRFDGTKMCLNKIIILLEKIQICTGVPLAEIEHMQYDIESRPSLTKETITKIGDENLSHLSQQCLRAKRCYQVLPWGAHRNACRACQHTIKRNDIGISKPGTETTDEFNKEDSDEMNAELEKVFSGASDEMKVLLKSQSRALDCKRTSSMKWDKRVLNVCLSMWVRSPSAYDVLKDSKMLILPSARQLRRYKNKLQKEAGVSDEVCRWMYMAEMDGNLEEHESDSEDMETVEDVSSECALDMLVAPGSSQAETSSRKRSIDSKGKGLKKLKIKKLKITKWLCGICEQDCTDSCVACDKCDKWHHYDCLGKNDDDDEFKGDKWLCSKCSNNP